MTKEVLKERLIKLYNNTTADIEIPIDSRIKITSELIAIINEMDKKEQ